MLQKLIFFVRLLASPAEFDYLAVFNFLPLYGKADKGSCLVPALVPCSAGVNMETMKFRIIDDLQDMGMAADKEAGPGPDDLIADGLRIFWRVTADMDH